MIDKEQAAAPAVGAVTGTPQKSTVRVVPWLPRQLWESDGAYESRVQFDEARFGPAPPQSESEGMRRAARSMAKANASVLGCSYPAEDEVAFSSTPIKRPRAAIETDLEEDEEIIAMSLEALKAKLEQVQAEAKIAIASIGAHDLAQDEVEDGDGEDGKDDRVRVRAAIDLLLDGEGDRPAFSVDLSQDGEGKDGGGEDGEGEGDRRRALVVDLAKDGEDGSEGGEGNGEHPDGDEDGDDSRYGSFHPNVAQSAALAVMEAGKSVVVIGAAGTGKTALILGKVKDRLRRSSGKVLLTGPYNTHVDKLRTDVSSDPELAEAVAARRIIFKTTAAAFSFPTRGIAKPLEPGHTRAHGHTDEPHNHPNPPTHPSDRETTESAADTADSTAAAPEPVRMQLYEWRPQDICGRIHM